MAVRRLRATPAPPPEANAKNPLEAVARRR